jgi:hypothetical protein
LFDRDAPRKSFEIPGIEAAHADGRAMSLLASSNIDEIVSIAKSLEPMSVEVSGVNLKEIFLECVRPN